MVDGVPSPFYGRRQGAGGNLGTVKETLRFEVETRRPVFVRPGPLSSPFGKDESRDHQLRVRRIPGLKIRLLTFTRQESLGV